MRRALALALVLALVATACSGEETETAVDVETASPGAYSEGGEVFVVYPEDAPSLDVGLADVEGTWLAATADLGFPDFGEPEGGIVTSARTDDDLRVWFDVATDGADGAVSVAQLTIENRATDTEDSLYLDQVIPAFLAAVGVTVIPDEFGLVEPDSLFDEGRTAEVTVDGVSLYFAMNKFSLVLGATGG